MENSKKNTERDIWPLKPNTSAGRQHCSAPLQVQLDQVCTKCINSIHGVPGETARTNYFVCFWSHYKRYPAAPGATCQRRRRRCIFNLFGYKSPEKTASWISFKYISWNNQIICSWACGLKSVLWRRQKPNEPCENHLPLRPLTTQRLFIFLNDEAAGVGMEVFILKITSDELQSNTSAETCLGTKPWRIFHLNEKRQQNNNRITIYTYFTLTFSGKIIKKNIAQWCFFFFICFFKWFRRWKSIFF